MVTAAGSAKRLFAVLFHLGQPQNKTVPYLRLNREPYTLHGYLHYCILHIYNVALALNNILLSNSRAITLFDKLILYGVK